jgi:hypothetical protein
MGNNIYDRLRTNGNYKLMGAIGTRSASDYLLKQALQLLVTTCRCLKVKDDPAHTHSHTAGGTLSMTYTSPPFPSSPLKALYTTPNTLETIPPSPNPIYLRHDHPE